MLIFRFMSMYWASPRTCYMLKCSETTLFFLYYLFELTCIHSQSETLRLHRSLLVPAPKKACSYWLKWLQVP